MATCRKLPQHAVISGNVGWVVRVIAETSRAINAARAAVGKRLMSDFGVRWSIEIEEWYHRTYTEYSIGGVRRRWKRKLVAPIRCEKLIKYYYTIEEAEARAQMERQRLRAGCTETELATQEEPVPLLTTMRGFSVQLSRQTVAWFAIRAEAQEYAISLRRPRTDWKIVPQKVTVYPM